MLEGLLSQPNLVEQHESENQLLRDYILSGKPKQDQSLCRHTQLTLPSSKIALLKIHKYCATAKQSVERAWVRSILCIELSISRCPGMQVF